MSDQHAATALTAAAVIAAILIARAAVLQQDRRRHRTGSAELRQHAASPTPRTAPHPATACMETNSAVREAEAHVRGCWQHLQTPGRPSHIAPWSKTDKDGSG